MATATASKDERLLGDRRKLGAFYTPEPLSEILAQWCIQSPQDLILEPSFGGCGFLQSAYARFISLGQSAPRNHIYGCDIDPIAFQYLAEVLDGPVDLQRFLQRDFLDIAVEPGWPLKFNAILANPPYIPYQAIPSLQRNELASRPMGIAGVAGRASLWAYFMAHAVSFLVPGGRMGWVLPGAFLQADYARPIRDYLTKSFQRVAAFLLHERIFLEEGTDEETVILLADGHLASPVKAGLDLADASSLEGLRSRIADWDAGRLTTADGARPAALSMSRDVLAELGEFDCREDSSQLGSVASIKIGLVTGANKFFVLKCDELGAAGLDLEDCTHVLAKFQAVRGLTYDTADHLAHLQDGGRGLLAGDSYSEPNARLRAYFDRFTDEERAKVGTFRKRSVWWRPHDGRIADAFFPVMHHHGPRIVLNPDCCANTNTIHRVYFKDNPTSSQRRLISISILTSYSQISAELVGRRYGSGVLKHEPREAERIRLLLPSPHPNAINATFKKV
ncbi:MAG TPA: N-6 DNA methylase, partial [Caulobacteraceae bacterium]|nr:N-6 DNA methylase [Caulobacteraceae bacterium]